MSIYNLPEHLQQRLRAELRAGESVVWAGQPLPNRLMASGAKGVIFFIPFTAFAVFWMFAASGFRVPDFETGASFFPLFGLPFLLIGLGGLLSPLWLRRRARATIYTITSQRAFTVAGGFTFTVKSYPLARMSRIERVQHADGSGDLLFQPAEYTRYNGNRNVERHGFIGVENVRQVEQLLNNAMRMQQDEKP